MIHLRRSVSLDRVPIFRAHPPRYILWLPGQTYQPNIFQRPFLNQAHQKNKPRPTLHDFVAEQQTIGIGGLSDGRFADDGKPAWEVGSVVSRSTFGSPFPSLRTYRSTLRCQVESETAMGRGPAPGSAHPRPASIKTRNNGKSRSGFISITPTRDSLCRAAATSAADKPRRSRTAGSAPALPAADLSFPHPPPAQCLVQRRCSGLVGRLHVGSRIKSRRAAP